MKIHNVKKLDEHVIHMNDGRIVQTARNKLQTGKQTIDRPRKRFKDDM